MYLAQASEEAVDFNQFNQFIWGSDNNDSGQSYWVRVGEALNDQAAIEKFGTPGGFITAIFPYLFAAGGLILFVMLLWGSMEILLGAASPKSAESGKKRITTALIGFLILFASFWIMQILQRIFGIDIGLSA